MVSLDQYYIIFFTSLALVGCGNHKIGTDTIITKTHWHGKPGKTALMKPHQITCITIHHEGVVDNGTRSGAEKMHGLQKFSQEQKNWGDVPYHYIIDLQGHVYEGRELQYAGDTNTSYDPTGHLLICVNGNYEEQEITPASYKRLVQFTVEKARQYNIPLEKIKTHQDYTKDTVCPGKNLYKFFESGQFYRDVAAALGSDKK